MGASGGEVDDGGDGDRHRKKMAIATMFLGSAMVRCDGGVKK